MKPSAFLYKQPHTLDEALLDLAEHGEEAKLLAGGQTLVPLLNFRMVAPKLLIDINKVDGLDRIDRDGEGGLRMGALVRWRQILDDPFIAHAYPVLAAAIKHVAHYQIRNRGTWAGSCAHADPSAEFPAIAILYGARFSLRRRGGERDIAANDFFSGLLSTALEPGEMLTEVQFPPPTLGQRWAFEEFAMRKGDFALAGAAALLDVPINSLRLVVFGAGPRAVRVPVVEDWISENGLGDRQVHKAARLAADSVEPMTDALVSAEYRRALVADMVSTVLSRLR